MNKTRLSVLCLPLLAALLVACAAPAQVIQTAIAQTQGSAGNTGSGFPTLAPPASQEPFPTAQGMVPTALPPQSLPVPTVVVDTESNPISLIGTGDSVVNVEKWAGPALLHARYTADGNFIATSYGSSNERLKLLINEIGSYEGTVPLDFENGQATARLEVKASGPWAFQILPLDSADVFDLPTTINGKGDSVVRLGGQNADTIMAIVPGEHNFIVQAYTSSGRRRLIFNEIAPYTGTALLDPATFILTIQATGPWSLQIATR